MFQSLPFQESDDLPIDIPSIENPIPLTLVNTRPLDNTPFIAPFVPCPLPVIPHAYKLARISQTDILMDMGCGDARILVHSNNLPPHERPKKVIGVELDPYLADHARKQLDGIVDEYEVIECDMFILDPVDLGVTVLILYLLPFGLSKLENILKPWLKYEGNRIVTVDYQISWMEPKSVEKIGKKSLYLYELS